MKAMAIDTETTGFVEPIEIIEFARTDEFDFPPDPAHDVHIKGYTFGCSKPIENGAMAAHHIINADLVGLQSWPGFVPSETLGYLIGHGIDYDWERIGKPDIKRIDTLAFCRQLWPEETKHSLGAMIYHITSDKAKARDLVKNAHSATSDVHMTYLLLLHILEIGSRTMPLHSWEDVWEWCEVARIPTRMWLGKHRGEPMEKVPQSYKTWALKNMTDPPLDKYQRIALSR